MPVILNNLRTDRVPMAVADLIWSDVANVDQEYAVGATEAPVARREGEIGPTTHDPDSRTLSGPSRDSQMRLEM